MIDDQETSSEQRKKPGGKPTLAQIVLSTFAAAFGVQSNKNRERDFTSGNIYIYIAAGIIFTIVFVIVMIVVVRAVLNAAGL